ncbi:HicB family protein [ANME-1 cluster archaeon GoMg4]|nr:HicB family protein [ANME-1 cluster archaeon GoMg4]
MYKYTIIIEKAEDNYSAYCPDLPGCIATGRTEEETIERMKVAIEFHIEGLRECKTFIPAPSTKAVSVEVEVTV